MMSTGDGSKLFMGSVDNNQLSDAEKQALLDNAVHEAKWVDQDGKKRLACAACTKTFSDRGHLRTHYNTVHLKTMYKCTVVGCEEWFSSMRARQRHIQSAHTPKPATSSPAIQPQQSAQSNQTFQQHQLIQPQQPQQQQQIAQQVIHPHTLIQQQSHPQQTVMQPIIQHQQQLVQHSPIQPNVTKSQLVHTHSVVHPQQAQQTQVYQAQQPQQHFVQQTTAVHHVQAQQQPIQAQPAQQQFQPQPPQQPQQFQQPQQQYQPQYQQQQRFQQPQHQAQPIQPAPQFSQTQQFHTQGQAQVRAPLQAVVTRHPHPQIQPQPQQAVTIVSTGIAPANHQAQPVNVVSSQAYSQEGHGQPAQVMQATAVPQTQTMIIPCGQASSTVTATTVQVVSSNAPQQNKPIAPHTCAEHSQAVNGHQSHVANSGYTANAPAGPQQPQMEAAAFAHRTAGSSPLQEHGLQQQQQQQHGVPQQLMQPQHGQGCQQQASQVEANRPESRAALKRENGAADNADPEGQPPAKMAAPETAAPANTASAAPEEEGEEEAGKRERQARSRAEREANEALSGFLDRLQELDLNGYFAYPMTEVTHPGCTVQLDRLSDLYSVRQKLRRGRYSSVAGLRALREDLDLVFSNAMKYYAEKSPEYRLAAKLWKTADDGLASLCAEFPTRFPLLFGPTSQAPAGSDVRTTTLPFLQPCNRGRVGKLRVATIGEEVGRPSNCVGPLPPLRDDRRNKIIPVSYLDYGPFASFAPTYDSGAAYCTKEDSDLVLGEFGPLSNGAGAERLNELNEDNALVVPEPELGDDFSLYMLNALTKDVLKEEREDGAESMTLEEILEEELGGGEAGKEEEAGAMLAETASKLGCLHEANFQRLGQPHNRAAHAPGPEEQALAERVAASLALMVGRNRPDDVVSTSALHRSMKVDISANGSTQSGRVACGEA